MTAAERVVMTSMLRRGWSLGYSNEVNVTTTFKMAGAHWLLD
jgi:hypothetical protein